MPPAKAVKTERTHEENQERAYIAASRRSDRSLEARVESARRASEIHKRRTGRSLRVTEQDVVNEEMYEEEDDDTPFANRRLNSYLNNAYPPNNKLAAYLATNVSMRNMVQQAVNDSYNQQYGIPPGGQHFGQPQMAPNPMVPSPMVGPQQSLAIRHSQTSSTHRQAPYSAPRPPTSQSGHSRSASIATPRELSGNVPISPVAQSSNDRRMSMPAVPAVPHTGSPIDPLTPVSASSSKSSQRPSFATGSLSQSQVPQQKPPPMRTFSELGPSNNGQNYGPFTTALPQDAQMFFGPDFNMNNLNMMTVNNNFSNSNWNLGSSIPSGMGTENQQQTHPTFGGLNATLAPSALDSTKPSNLDVSSQHSQYIGMDSFDDMFFGQESTPGTKLEENNATDWDSFMNWGDMPPASQQSQSST